MGYTKIWIHIVWNTKCKIKLLSPEFKKPILDHIQETAQKKDIYIDSINGHEQHIHCLISMNATQSIDKIVQQLKGESSFWINREKLFNEKFSWQHEYFAVSVGESSVRQVRRYIENQEEHHKRKSFEEEYQEFIKAYNFSPLVRG